MLSSDCMLKQTAQKSVVIKYIAMSLVLIASGAARVLGLMPFGTGLFMSLCLVGLNPLVLAPVYLASSFAFTPSLFTLLGAGTASLVFIVLWLINRKKKLPEYVFFLAAPFSLLGFVPVMLSEPAAFILYVFLVPITMYVGWAFFRPVFTRGLRFRLLDTELICGGVILCVLALGLFRADVFYFPAVGIFAAFAVLFFGRIYGMIGSLIAGICFGIGGAVYGYDIVWLAYFPVMALISAVFLPAPRILGAIGNLIGFTLVTYFFDVRMPYPYLWLAALLAGGLVYVVIPKKAFSKLKNYLNPAYSPAGARYNINLLREAAARSIYKTGEVFDEMSFYITNAADARLDTAALVASVRGYVCKGCGKQCGVGDGDIEKLIAVSIEKGRANVVDLPQVIVDRCRMSAPMIGCAASLAAEYHQRLGVIGSENLAKGIVGEQLHGIGEVLKTMSDKLKTPISYEFERENKIKEEFTYRGIYCYDAVISQNAVTLIIAPEHYNRSEIERILFNVTGTAYKVEREDNGTTGVIVYAVVMPVYDVVFASASIAKGEVSGDTHSFIKIDGSKFMMALCDGMGCGKAAEKFSAGTVSLIECFYKAGFDHGMVIKSVNRFLSLSSEESFSASDICVIDLMSGLADIFKIGSPPCYIKGAETVRAVEGSSLPIGLLDEIKPSFNETALKNGDMVIFVTDGLADCFEGDSLIAEISCASDVSPDALVKRLLATARSRTKKVRDDMTVTAFRLFSNTFS